MILSADHRAIDGAMAARFMSDLRAVLEEPQLMVI
jgi:pyruvate/2-oxoglutarate dehydrogenase complex dihydrolipoamide acyltransferase (E2) component